MTTSMKMLEKKAKQLGASSFGISTAQGKRFYVIYENKKINFGAKLGRTYLDHADEQKKNAWLARHSKIVNKAGERVINLKTSPSYWSANLLW